MEEASTMNAAQAPLSKLLPNNQCKNHGKEFVYVCEKCCKVVCMVCATSTHKGHAMEILSEMIPCAKQTLQDFITKAEQIQLPNVKGLLQAVDGDLCKSKNYYKNQIMKIEEQSEILKKAIDDVTKKFIQSCKDMEEQNTNALLYYKSQLQEWDSSFTAQLQDLKSTLQSENDCLVYDKSQTLSTFKELPEAPSNTAEFIPVECSLAKLEQLFGELSIKSGENEPMLNCQNSDEKEEQTFGVVSKFNFDNGMFVKSMRPTCDGRVWASFITHEGYCFREAKLLDKNGNVDKTAGMEVVVTDFSLSPRTDDIWFCSYDDNSVRERTKDKSMVKFKADAAPSSICMTQDGHVIWGYGKNVVKHTKCCQTVVCKTTEEYPPQVKYPYHISECPVTSNLAVVDWDWVYYGGSDSPCISIFDQNLGPLYCYHGNTLEHQSPHRRFKPCDVCYTNEGNIVVTDSENKTVLLLDNKAEYIQTLYTNQESEPRAVCCNRDGSVWISFKDGSVHVLKEI